MDKVETLLNRLEELHPDSSKTTLRGWIQHGRVSVNGVVVRSAKQPISPQQEIVLEQRHRPLGHGIRLYYQDRDLIVVEKPAGLLSVATEYDDGRHLHGILKQLMKPRRVFPVHRLDRDTSGILLFALHQEARDLLRNAFAKHAIERHYIAIVEGTPLPPSGRWVSYLLEDRHYFVRSVDETRGERAVTHYRVEEGGGQVSRLALRLETGRKNQIRVHCSEAGHPVVGDRKYGSTMNPIKRLCLHAHTLGFEHPINGRTLRFRCPAPESFAAALAAKR